MVNGAITTEDLLELTGYEREGDLRRALDDQHIPYFLGKGGKPWTTIGLIESAKGLRTTQLEDQKLGAEIL